jgi:hypothetical protein
MNEIAKDTGLDTTPEHERKIRISVDLMNTLCTRDGDGNRLRVEWGKPDAEGFFVPMIHIDYEDNPFRKGLQDATARIEALKETLHLIRGNDGCERFTTGFGSCVGTDRVCAPCLADRALAAPRPDPVA